jgi:hypothetical protein
MNFASIEKCEVINGRFLSDAASRLGKWMKRIKEWFGRIGQYSFLTISVKHWIPLLLIFGCVAGSTLLSIINHSNPESKTFVAQVDHLWTRQWYDETGGGVTYFVRLVQDQAELVCRVPPFQVQLWNQLEIGKSYEFTATWTAGKRCYINQAVEVEDSRVRE